MDFLGAKKLEEKWGKLVQGIKDGYTRRVTAVLLENQLKHVVLEQEKLREDDSTAGMTSVGKLGTFQKFAFPLVRRVYPNLIANSIISTQPMQGPVSQVFYLGHSRQFGSTEEVIYSQFKLTYNGFVTSAIGGSGLDGDNDVNFSSLLATNKGTPSTTFGGQIAAWPDATTILGYNVSAGERLSGSAIPEINFHIEAQSVNARTRKMRALWTIEAQQDLKAYHNLDLESELTTLLSQEVSLEIDRELIEDLRHIAYDPNNVNFGGWKKHYLSMGNSNNFPTDGAGFVPAQYLYDFSNAGGGNPSGTNKNVWVVDLTSSAFPFAPQHVGHVYANLLAVINLASQDIFKTTMRSPGNWLLTSPLVGSWLESAAKLEGGLERSDGPTNMDRQIQFKGKFAGKYDLYIDPLFPEDEILMGYKGSNAMDTGYVYCPYIPIQLTPTITDPITFQPRKGLITRYGKVAVSPESRFYRVLRLIGPGANYLYSPFRQSTGNTPG